MPNQCVIFVANRAYALSNSRKKIIERFLSCNFDVVIATKDDEDSRRLCDLGVIHEIVNFDRGGFSPISDYLAYSSMKRVFRKWKPSIIHNFHSKPIILGAIAARAHCGNKTVVVNTITGLGHAFITRGLQSSLASFGYRLALPKADCTIFQNRDDLSLFMQNNWVCKDNSLLITGSGVDITRFSRTEQPSIPKESFNIIMVGRLLKQKGILEFIEVAKEITKSFPNIQFILAGEEDPVHPDAITGEWVRQQSAIEYVGHQSNILPLYQKADILLFPSYREGVPRVVLEAAAMGIPTVAFDVPGVREVVVHNETGFLADLHDINSMIKQISSLIQDPQLRLDFGVRARSLMVKNFDIELISEKYLSVYRSLGINI